jgi:hypothetical protein
MAGENQAVANAMPDTVHLNLISELTFDLFTFS